MMSVDVKDQKGVIVINRYTEKTTSSTGFIVVDGKSPRNFCIRFSRGAVDMLKLHHYTNVEFVVIGKDWFVCVTNLKRGYKVQVSSASEKKINSSIMVRSLLASIECPANQIKLRLRKTLMEYNAMPLFKIDISKILPINGRVVK